MKKIVLTIIFIMISAIGMNTYATETLTKEEKEYISNNEVVYVIGNKDLYPIEYYDEANEKFVGVMPEIMKKISEKTGLKFEYINKRKDEKIEEIAKNLQAEIISAIDVNEIDMKEYNIKYNIEYVYMPQNDKVEKISIAFTTISDDKLINIINKSLEKISEEEKQYILLKNVMKEESKNNMQYIILITILILSSIIIYLFIRLKKVAKLEKQQKYMDNLTGYGNYQNMELNFNNYINDENRCTYCVINILTDISNIEKRYGYSEVSEVLKYISNVINEYTMDNEMFSRIYNDSFVIIAQYASEDAIVKRINLINNKVLEFNKAHKKSYALNINVGIYCIKPKDKQLSKIVYNALQASKYAENNNILYKIADKALIRDVNRKYKLEESIINGFENDEFVTYLQPIIDIKNGEISSCEALARWNNREEGFIKPSIFLDILEKNNMVSRLDMLMFENICKFIQNRQKNHKELFVIFCNFSRINFNTQNFCSTLNEIIRKYNVPAEYIGIIITESIYTEKVRSIKKIINELRKIGFKVVLDNFGTSFYSFRDIKEFSIDYLKLSPNFVEDIDDSRTIAITKGFIEIAHEINIKVICEEIENMEQISKLKEINCDMIQGFAVYPPMPIKEFDKIN